MPHTLFFFSYSRCDKMTFCLTCSQKLHLRVLYAAEYQKKWDSSPVVQQTAGKRPEIVTQRIISALSR